MHSEIVEKDRVKREINEAYAIPDQQRRNEGVANIRSVDWKTMHMELIYREHSPNQAGPIDNRGIADRNIYKPDGRPQMTRILAAALIALVVSGPAWGDEPLAEEWYTHHLVCGEKKPAKGTWPDTSGYSYIHFTFRTDERGHVKKLIAQREHEQYPSFAKAGAYPTYVRNYGVHWSTFEKKISNLLEVTLYKQELARIHTSHFVISRSDATYSASYFSILNDGKKQDHGTASGVCWMGLGKLF